MLMIIFQKKKKKLNDDQKKNSKNINIHYSKTKLFFTFFKDKYKTNINVYTENGLSSRIDYLVIATGLIR